MQWNGFENKTNTNFSSLASAFLIFKNTCQWLNIINTGIFYSTVDTMLKFYTSRCSKFNKRLGLSCMKFFECLWRLLSWFAAIFLFLISQICLLIRNFSLKLWASQSPEPKKVKKYIRFFWAKLFFSGMTRNSESSEFLQTNETNETSETSETNETNRLV